MTDAMVPRESGCFVLAMALENSTKNADSGSLPDEGGSKEEDNLRLFKP